MSSLNQPFAEGPLSAAQSPEPSAVWTPALRSWLADAARAAGFALAGVAAVPPSDENSAATPEAERFSHWIHAGHAGEMEYLKRRDASGALLRASVSTAFPWARSVIVCAANYHSASPSSIDPAPSDAAWIARYARSGRPLDDGSLAPADYHDDLLLRLRNIESALVARAACTARSYVDTGPILERSIAAAAGIGWNGKNTCLINQQLGSWLLLCVIVTSLPAESPGSRATREPGSDPPRVASLPAADRCGTCTRCIDACPAGALLGSRQPDAPRQMDASRCIAYLTIEKKGDIPEELRAPIGRNVFGCDICQEVCPWNAKAAPLSQRAEQPEAQNAPTEPRHELINPSLGYLASMDSAAFRRLFRASPLERTGRKRLLRNVAIAMGNTGDPQFLPRLEQFLSTESGDHPNDLALRKAAAWARDRILACAAEQNR